MKPLEIKDTCTCGAKLGETHVPGCSIDRCPFCGVQMLQDDCCYEFFGIDVINMEETHPDIFHNGLPDEMDEKWEEHLRPHLLPWDGVYPGTKECREYDLWCKWTANGWETCSADDPEATEDLNALARYSTWDKEHKRYVIDERMLAYAKRSKV